MTFTLPVRINTFGAVIFYFFVCECFLASLPSTFIGDRLDSNHFSVSYNDHLGRLAIFAVNAPGHTPTTIMIGVLRNPHFQ
jgi:hypothetical protein